MSPSAYIGIDLGGTNCRCGLVGQEGEVVASRVFATDLSRGPEAFLQGLENCLRELFEQGRSLGMAVPGGGIGIPGVVDQAGRISACPNLPPLTGLDLAGHLARNLGRPFVALNDANAIALGEARCGAARGLESFLAVTLGTGVGGGLVLGGRLWRGGDGAAGEIGHLMVEAEGRPCGCGARGCLERYASATGILETVRKQLSAGRDSELRSAGLTAARVAEAARRGDEPAREAFALAGRRLGQALSGVVNLLNLDGLVFCGRVSASFDLLRPGLEEELALRVFALPRQRLQLRVGTLGDAAGILGAAGWAAETFAESA